MSHDVVVLGAGIVGTSVAVHLQSRGMSTLLIDRGQPGSEATFGNAGVIQREGVFPYGFPQSASALLRYAGNRTPDLHYHANALFGMLPFFLRYWWNSRSHRYGKIAREYAPLIEHSVSEHRSLAFRADAGQLLRTGGWIQVYRTARALERASEDASRRTQAFGIRSVLFDSDTLHQREPDLLGQLVGGIHWIDPVTVSDPHALTRAYAALFERLGGTISTGQVLRLERAGGAWRVSTDTRHFASERVVVALGAGAGRLLSPLGYRIPMGIKRGYHMHYGAAETAQLRHTLLDAEGGYVLAPMARGIRLTTGAEFARADAPATPIQLARAEPLARRLFPLRDRLDQKPWMGLRPCMPDMLPVIGPAPGHGGLWFAFGHGHHGLTLGPATGRLLAEMMTEQTPFIDPSPYRVDRL